MLIVNKSDRTQYEERCTFNDITISKRSDINQIGDRWIQEECEEPVDLAEWESFVPKMDMWLDISRNEIHYVSGIIPTLKWRGGELGVRLAFLPKDISKLFLEYREAYFAARKTEKAKEKVEIRLYPKNLCEFLEKNFNTYFSIKTFILDPANPRCASIMSTLMIPFSGLSVKHSISKGVDCGRMGIICS